MHLQAPPVLDLPERPSVWAISADSTLFLAQAMPSGTSTQLGEVYCLLRASGSKSRPFQLWMQKDALSPNSLAVVTKSLQKLTLLLCEPQ